MNRVRCNKLLNIRGRPRREVLKPGIVVKKRKPFGPKSSEAFPVLLEKGIFHLWQINKIKTWMLKFAGQRRENDMHVRGIKGTGRWAAQKTGGNGPGICPNFHPESPSRLFWLEIWPRTRTKQDMSYGPQDTSCCSWKRAISCLYF